MHRFSWVLACCSFGSACLAQTSTSAPATTVPHQPRHALVLGNANYDSLPKLPGASREATTIAEALQKAEFDILTVADFRYPGIVQATEPKFVSGVKEGDTCLVYFSGYSVQAFGETYLLPVNFDPKTKVGIQQAYSLTRLLQLLSEKKAGVKVVLLEASHDVEVPIENVTAAGPAPPDLSDLRQVLFAFAAPPGQTTHQTRDEAGLFTQTIARDLLMPGMDINAVFLQVQREVAKTSGQAQLPYVSGNITTELVLIPKLVTATKEDRLPLGLPAVDPRDREEYVWITAGKFPMGCVSGDTKCEAPEKPQHPVTIAHGFWMGRNEVQAISYRRFVDANHKKMPSGPLWDTKWKQEDHPIVNVSWQDAESYCEWAGGRLPTEAEWEYAARGGLANQIYPLNSENSREKANFSGKAGNDTFEFTAPVRKFDPNPFKLFDMSGNVWEWVRDWYSPDYYQGSPEMDPPGPESGKEHVARGGSFDSDPKTHLRISIRKPFGKATNNVGFRCVLEDTPKTQELLRGVQ